MLFLYFYINLYTLWQGFRPVIVNGTPVLTGESIILQNNAVVEFSSLRFIFLINQDLIAAIRTETFKNNFIKTLS